VKKRALSAAAATAALTCLLFSPPAIRAQKRTKALDEATVRNQLAIYALALSLANASLIYEPVGKLKENAFDNIPVRLYRGYHYSLIGVCDTDCKTLGLNVYSEDGSRVASYSAGWTVSRISTSLHLSPRTIPSAS
jgi:hypothetical protein